MLEVKVIVGQTRGFVKYVYKHGMCMVAIIGKLHNTLQNLYVQIDKYAKLYI